MRMVLLVPALLSLCACASLVPKAPEPRSMAGLSDSGTFMLYARGTKLGTIDFALAEGGAYEDSCVIAYAGQEARSSTKIVCDDRGLWVDIESSSATQKIAVHRDGGFTAYKEGAATRKIALPSGSIPIFSYGPALQSLFVRAYDKASGGVQTFPCYGIPNQVGKATLSFAGKETREVGGREVSFDLYDSTSLSISYRIWAEPNGRVDLIRSPAQRRDLVRKGFEALLRESGDPAVNVERETIMVTMRDGVGLATDIYRPVGGAGPWPVILIRTPYKKEMEELDAMFYARYGYIVAVQDCRGRFGSQGIWTPWFDEGRDGYDAVERVAASPGSSGKVGMIGGSYSGWNQLAAAAERPPHLAAIIPNVSPPDPFRNLPYEYGAFFLFGSAWWMSVVESKATEDLSGVAMQQASGAAFDKAIRSLPVIDLDKRLVGREVSYWRDWILHDSADGWWSRASFMPSLGALAIPVFLQSGWFDGDGIGTKLNALELERSPAMKDGGKLKIVVGPWGHTDTASARVGGMDFGKSAVLDLQSLYLEWFDRWLKGADNGIDREAPVKLFVMGRNDWIEGPTYPLPQTVFTSYYLNPPAKSRTGGLSTTASSSDGSQSYTYDPTSPTPDVDTSLSASGKAVNLKTAREKALAERKDILVFETPPLAQAVTICGPVQAELYAASTALDTDWCIKFMAVTEGGWVIPLSRGVIRARFRDSLSQPESLVPGEAYRYTIDLWHTGYRFSKGQRIRIEVSSALFPTFSRNLNTGGSNEMDTRSLPARQTVYGSSAMPSRLILPVIPELPTP